MTRACRSIERKFIFSLHRGFTHFEGCLIYLNVSLLCWSARIRLKLESNNIFWLKTYMSCNKTRIICNLLKVGHLRALKWSVADTLKKPPRPSETVLSIGQHHIYVGATPCCTDVDLACLSDVCLLGRYIFIRCSSNYLAIIITLDFWLMRQTNYFGILFQTYCIV